MCEQVVGTIKNDVHTWYIRTFSNDEVNKVEPLVDPCLAYRRNQKFKNIYSGASLKISENRDI